MFLLLLLMLLFSSLLLLLLLLLLSGFLSMLLLLLLSGFLSIGAQTFSCRADNPSFNFTYHVTMFYEQLFRIPPNIKTPQKSVYNRCKESIEKKKKKEVRSFDVPRREDTCNTRSSISICRGAPFCTYHRKEISLMS